MPGSIDWLVLTAANRRQARAFASQVAARAEHGPLARTRGMLGGVAAMLAIVALTTNYVKREFGRGQPGARR